MLRNCLFFILVLFHLFHFIDKMAMSSDERSIQTDVKTNAQHLEQDVDVAKVVHADGTVDYIDARAVGGDFEEMPKGYFYSPQFIGTVAVSYAFNSGSESLTCQGTNAGQHLRVYGMGATGKHTQSDKCGHRSLS